MRLEFESPNKELLKAVVRKEEDGLITISYEELNEYAKENEIDFDTANSIVKGLVKSNICVSDTDCLKRITIFSHLRNDDVKEHVEIKINPDYLSLRNNFNERSINLNEVIELDNVHSRALYILIAEATEKEILIKGEKQIKDKLVASRNMRPSTFKQNIFNPAVDELRKKGIVPNLKYELIYSEIKGGPISAVKFTY